MAKSATLRRPGAKLRALRNDAGLTQRQLAERVELAVESVSRLEGGRLNVSVNKLARIAKTLDTTMAALFADAAVDDEDGRTARRGERKILQLLAELEETELTAVHRGLRSFLTLRSTAPKRKRRTR